MLNNEDDKDYIPEVPKGPPNQYEEDGDVISLVVCWAVAMFIIVTLISIF